jgi:hypothetical protein
MPNLIGTAPNQVPVNGSLGTMAFQDSTSVKVDSLTANNVTATAITGALTGNAATVTNGVYTSGDQTIGGNKTFSNTILGSISGATGTFSGDAQMASLNGGQLAGLRNKIINGNMGIAQRGAAAVTAIGYGPADRWYNEFGGDTFSTTLGSFVSGDTLYDTGGAQSYSQVAITSVAAAGNYIYFSQRIEDVRLLAGQTVTVSFWAKVAAGTPSIGISVDQYFGTGGSPSATATGTGQAQALTTTWTKYSKTFTVPSINGKTIGTAANTSFSALVFWLDAGSSLNTRSGSIGQSSKTVSIAQVQLEVGPVATPFEQRPYGMELALCQRYYYRINAITGTGAFHNVYMNSATGAQGIIPFPVQMRTNPTALEQSGTATDYRINYAATNTTCNTVPAFNTATNYNNGFVNYTVAAGLTAGQAGAAIALTTAAYLGWSAEL